MHRGRWCFVMIAAWLLFGHSPPSRAGTEVYIDGNFRLRARVYDNLFLKRGVALSDASDPLQVGDDGTSSYFEQRLRLEPELRVNQYLSVFSQFDFLPDLMWGTNPERIPGLSGYYDPIGQSQSFSLPSNVPVVAARRLWAEVFTPFGRFKFGRTGMHVGSGVYFNDGRGPDADYPGDTADRIQFLTRVGNVFLLAGYDMIYEGDVDRPYDAQAAAAAVAYRSELLSGSFYTYYQDDRSWLEEGDPEADDTYRNNMKTWTFDLWGKSVLGSVELELEAIYRYGGGDGSRMVFEAEEDGVDPRVRENVVINSFGGIARLNWSSRHWRAGVETGLASGDDDPAYDDQDGKLKTFEFDRNYHVGLLLFRVPMPARASLASDVSPDDIYDGAIVGNRISNAFYVAPSLRFNILTNLTARVGGIGAWALTATSDFNGSKDYGYEFDIELASQLFDRLTLSATTALFFPGGVFGSNDEFAFGGQLLAVVAF